MKNKIFGGDRMKKRKILIKCYNCDHVWRYGGQYKKFKNTTKFDKFYICCSKCHHPLNIRKLKEFLQQFSQNELKEQLTKQKEVK